METKKKGFFKNLINNFKNKPTVNKYKKEPIYRD